jgi:hypothetical protein
MLHSSRRYASRLTDAFGLRFCTLLCSVYLGLKGPVYTMMASAQLPYFKYIGITGVRRSRPCLTRAPVPHRRRPDSFFRPPGVPARPNEQQRFQSFGVVTSTPWAMKAAIGIISDSVPILGERLWRAAAQPARCGARRSMSTH